MLHGNLNLRSIVTILSLLNGEEGVAAILNGKQLETPKYGSMTLGKFEAIINLLGGQENAEAILRGEKDVTLVDAIMSLFDKNGRRIPPRMLNSAVCDRDGNFYLRQPDELDLKERLDRFDGAGLNPCITLQEFSDSTKGLLRKIRENERIANLLKGVYLPIIIPYTATADYGRMLDTLFIPAVANSYRRQFANRNFIHYRKGDLEGKVTIVPGSRHEQLVERIAKGSVVGIYFPNPLQGFSVDAQREQMSSTPEGLLLSGAIDTSMGWLMYPDILARDNNTPVYDCSANQWHSPTSSLHFEAYDGNANFAGRADLSHASSSYSGGLLFVG